MSVLAAWILAIQQAHGGAVRIEGTSAIDACSSPCKLAAENKGADILRTAAAAAEGLAIGLSPAVVHGTGFSMEISANTLSLPKLSEPSGANVFPIAPRLAIGGFAGHRLRAGGGLQGGLAFPYGGDDLGFSLGARGGFAFASPEERRWIGFEFDAGYGVVTGKLFDTPQKALDLLSGGGIPIDGCASRCDDLVTLLHAGADSTFSFDIDPLTSFFGRIGGVFQQQTLDVASDSSVWRWRGLLPRTVLGLGYRPQRQSLLTAAMRLGPLEEGSHRTVRLLWLASIGFDYRFGEPPPTPTPIAPPPAPVVEKPPIVVPKIPVAEHPDLNCGPERISTGSPPPSGFEGWCVLINELGVVLTDGPYIRWHDQDHIAQRGENRLGQAVGTWTELYPSGALMSYGAYSDGLKEGVWRIFYESGALDTEGSYHRGLQTGHWVIWNKESTAVTEGEYQNGMRTGQWRDYRDNQLVRIREFREGKLMSDELLSLPQ